MQKMYKIEVIADSTGKWAGNAMRYDTHEEAEAAARSLARRWCLVTDWRVVKLDPQEAAADRAWIHAKDEAR